jgi:glycosyltransferase involved in cell wall biosynthesis
MDAISTAKTPLIPLSKKRGPFQTSTNPRLEFTSMFPSQRSLWLTWMHQRRNDDIAAALGVELFEILAPFRNRILRYLWCSYQTFVKLSRKNPEFVFAQNPSIILAVLLLALRPLFRYRLILDDHNAGVFPLEGEYAVLQAVSRYLLRKADLNIVTNPAIAQYVTANGGRAVVLPDPVPNLPDLPPRLLMGTKQVLFVCSFSRDESYGEVLSAARYLPPKVVIYVSGDSSRLPPAVRAEVSPNIVFTGYVSDREYTQYLQSVNVVLVLTHRENCLVRGAYEAIAARKPLILSNRRALRRFFGEEVLYTENRAADISKTILSALAREDELRARMRKLDDRLRKDWLPMLAKLRETLSQMRHVETPEGRSTTLQEEKNQ